MNIKPLVTAWLKRVDSCTATIIREPGNVHIARQLFQSSNKRVRTDYLGAYEIALVYAGLNEKRQAFRVSSRRERITIVASSLRSTLPSNWFRSDSRCVQLLSRVGLNDGFTKKAIVSSKRISWSY